MRVTHPTVPATAPPAAAQDRARDATRWARGPMWRGGAVPIIARPEHARSRRETHGHHRSRAAGCGEARAVRVPRRRRGRRDAQRGARRDGRPPRPLPRARRRRAADAGRARRAHRHRRALRARMAQRPGRGRLRRLRPADGRYTPAARAGRRADRRGQPRVPARVLRDRARLRARLAADHRGRPHRRRASAGTSTTTHVHDGCERFFRPGYNANLVDAWLPALDGVVEQLERGGTVADVGCGHGASTILMAQAFPNSTFVGSDYHAGSIETARQRARRGRRRGPRRASRSRPPPRYGGAGYDLVTMFDCLHDMGDPVGAARHVRDTLAPDGTWMIVEPAAGDRVEDNLNPVGRAYYGFSTLLCTPASLVAGRRPRARRAGRPGADRRGRRARPASAASAAPPRRRSTSSSRRGSDPAGARHRSRRDLPAARRAAARPSYARPRAANAAVTAFCAASP